MASLNKSIDRLYKELFQISVSGTIQKIASKAYEIWQCPVSIIDVQYNILCMLPHGSIADNTWDKINVRKKVPENLLTQFIEGRYLEESSKTSKAVLVNWGIAEGTPRVVCRICADDRIKGFISIVLQDSISWAEEDNLRLELLAQAAGLLLFKSPNFTYDTNVLQSAFYTSLLDNVINSREMLQKWIISLSLAPKEFFWVLCFTSSLKTTSFTAHFEYVYKHIKKQFSGFLSTCKNDRIYVLLNSDHIDDARRRISNGEFDFYADNGFAIGFSRAYTDIMQTPIFKDQADSCLRLGMENPVPSFGSIFRYKDFVINNIVSCICQNIPQENFLHPATHILKEYDLHHKTEYYLTLKHYTVSFFNNAYTIEKLRIHRNTLLYRLNQIQTITGIDLSDHDTCLNLLINFKAEEVLGLNTN